MGKTQQHGALTRGWRAACVGAAAILITSTPVLVAAQAPATERAPSAASADAGAAASAKPAQDTAAPGGDAGADGAARPSISFSMLPHDLSPLAMFQGADGIVKAVMLMLITASVLTWTVWLAKSVELRQARRKLVVSVAGLDEAGALADIANRGDPIVASMLAGARKELAQFPAPHNPTVATGIKERIAARLERIEAAAGKRMRRGTTVLASIGATAPFVGLFGTVWGIMNSFVGISQAQTTNLAVVAPGIAEALLATALGLVAAIPAVLIYNSCVRAVSGYRVLVADAATLFMCIVSRELDRQAFESREPVRELDQRRAVAVK